MPKREAEGETITREKVDTQEPPMFRVVLLNDDYTSMDFVVTILIQVFCKSAEEAHAVMLAVHQKGSGTAGIYTKEIAETKVAKVHQLARQHEFPLRCIMEEA